MEIGNYIIKKATGLGADDVVCTIKSGLTRQVKFVNNEIILNTTWDTIDAGIFLSHKKRLIASTLGAPGTIENYPVQRTLNTLSRKSIDQFLTRMVKVAKMMKPKEDYHGIAKGPFKYRKIGDGYDSKVAKLEGKEIDFVHDAIDSALKEGAIRSTGVLYAGAWETEVFSSNDVIAKDNGTSINISIRSFGKDSSGHSLSVSRMLNGFNPKKAGSEAGALAKQGVNPELGEAGKYDVILSPMVMANILYYMSYGFSAFEVDSGMSFLIDKIRKKVGNDNVTILDDGRMPNGFGSRAFDDEGRPTQKTEIIKNGVLKTYLHNTSTAKKFGVESTANAGLVYPHPNNLVLERGDSSLDEMISQVKDGVYITNVWYTRFSNYRTGDFSTIPRDAMFEIKNGKIARSVKGLRLSDNLQHVLESMQSISKDTRTIQWWEVETPIVTGHVLCEGLNMTKSAK